jgi:predicted HicB family RNase H-like nuclease
MSYKKSSLVWDSFKKTSSGTAQCQVNGCAENISNKGGNTTTMKKHLEKIHNISTQKKRPASEELEDSPPEKKSYNSGMLPFVSRESLHEIIAKCAAKDGISFSTIVKSEAIQGYVKSRNYKMPTSSTTVQKLVAQFFEEKKEETKNNIKKKISNGEKFTITADEWTDIVLRRYLNVTLHSVHEQVVLGLVPIIESCTSEKTEELVFQRLKDFGVDFTQDIVASTHDGARVMVKYGQIISAESQCCYNHAVHLSVVETFYQKKSFDSLEDTELSDEETEEEELSDAENGDFIFESESNIPNIHSDYKVALDKMRKIIKFFRKSSVRTEILLKHVTAKEGKAL